MSKFTIINIIILFACVRTTSKVISAQVLDDSEYRLFLPVIMKSSTNSDIDDLSAWSQVQRNPQRTGFYPGELETKFDVAWTYPFQPEKVFPQVQAIVSVGKVFVGTTMGNLYAINALDGSKAWSFSVGSPILNSVVVASGKVIFGAMDGAVYAVDASTGTLVWKSQLSQHLGFSTAPVLADSKVMLGGRDSIFYALNPDTGAIVWSYDTGSPILQTAAWNNGKVFFGAMDMHVYAINSANGTLAWKSESVDGMAFKDYWPVVHQGKVYIRPMGPGKIGVSSTEITSIPAQQAKLAEYETNPGEFTKNLFVFDEVTGQEAPAVIQYDYQTMNGATSPPCVDRDGYLAVPAPDPEGSYRTGWGRLDAQARVIVDVLNDGTDSGYGNKDENMNLSCTENLILAIHIQESNAQFTGAFDLDDRTWTKIGAGFSNKQMSTNTQGGGGNPVSISGGMIYHISYYELIARTTE